MRARAILISLALVARTASAQSPSALPAPDAHFGFHLGSDGRLASADAIDAYFEAVAAVSDRVKLVDLGSTTENHRTLAAIVSSPVNIRNLDRIRAANEQLADPRTLTDDEARRLAATQKAVVAIGASIHATEIGATQTAAELLYTLASASDDATRRELDDLVVIVIPMLNPDGHRLVVDWYNRTRATAFEGGSMPWPDHKYAGHDINRDGFMMNLAESRNLAHFFYREWHPQVFLSMHQMDNDGARFFTPPVADPVDPNVDAMIWREAALLGSAMTLELERDGHAGVVSGSLFDYYSPAYEDTAPLGHNTVCLLTEAASVKVATPVNVPKSNDPPHVAAPHPWPGGPWTLRDIMDYELSAVRGLLREVGAHREDLVWNFYAMGKRAVDEGRKGGPFAFVIPPTQYDPMSAVKLEQALIDAGVEIDRVSEPFSANGASYGAGTDIIFLAQPYRAYVRTLLERQRYPDDGSRERPYDVTAWTLPAQMGVDVRVVDAAFDPPVMSALTSPAIVAPPVTVWGDRKPSFFLIETRGTGGAIVVNRVLAANLKASWLDAPMEINGFRYAAGSLVVPAEKNTLTILQGVVAPFALRIDGVRGKMPSAIHAASQARVAIYKPWSDDTDEGWTRWVFEQYEFPFTSVSPADVQAGHLRGRFDAIVLPSESPGMLKGGLSQDEAPAPYAGGLGESGLAALELFVREGGTLICLDASGDLALDLFNLSVRDVARSAGDRLVAPGTIVRLDVDVSDPLAYGVPPQTSAFFASSSAYAVPAGGDIKIAARYGTKDLLVSGLLHGADVIAGQPAVITVPVAAGRVVLLGFRVQHRAQSLATFRLLFNAVFSSR